MSAHRDLVRGLTRDHAHLYQNSPYFKTTIDALVSLLPLWVDGIAQRAEGYDRNILAMEKFISAPLMPGILDLTKDAQRDLGFSAARDR